jgi:hypothetical protein
MNIETNHEIHTLLHKDIQDNIPGSNRVDYRTFSRLLDDDKVVASYKMYWLLGILDDVSLGREEIEFKRIISRMIVYSWYPLLQYRLSFGMFDNLKKPVNYVAQMYRYKSNCNERELLDFLYTSEDQELQKMMRELSLKVPYRLLSPFFARELRGMKDHLKDTMIVELSLLSKECLYRIVKGERDRIIINPEWGEYLKANYKVIKAWIYYKLICFIQKRNPNVPAIAFKLEAPRSRDLTKATKIWKDIIVVTGIKDIYTGKDFGDAAFKEHGVLSIDHFIPWSFVLHDEIWNLVPTFKNVNSAKSDKLLIYNDYIDSFCDIQYKAFTHICKKRMENVLEDYVEGLRLEDPYDYYRCGLSQDFNAKLKQCISPLYQIAVNQGFMVVDRVV